MSAMRSPRSLGILLMSTLAACGGPEPTAPPDSTVSGDGSELVAASAAPPHHPEFVRKLRSPATYRVDPARLLPETLCGDSDLQLVNDYDGSLGVSRAFVSRRKGPVGAMTATPTGGKYCSGTLVGPDLFLTASHCVGVDTVGQYVAFNYERRARSTDLLPQDFYQIVAVAEDGSGQGLDYAVVRLDGHPAAKYGTSTPKAAEPAAGALLAILQHPNGEPKQLATGHLGSKSGDYLTYADLDTLPGSSGSGVLDAAGDIIAVHTNGGCALGGGANSGVRMSHILKKSTVLR